MELTVARYDTDDTPAERGVPRPTPEGAALPTGFPFLLDEETGAVIEPVLVHLATKFYGGAGRRGPWRYKESADAAAGDLKDWWTFLARAGAKWDNVSENLLARYLTGLLSTVSEATENFLSGPTFSRRCSSIDAFHAFAATKWPKGRYPRMDSSKLLAGVGSKPSLAEEDQKVHPISRTNVNRIAAYLGPLPSKRTSGSYSRSRLAFELGLNVGLRVDEICNLPAALFEKMTPEGEDWDAIQLKVTKTKGLVARTVFVPNWLVRETKLYIEGERADAEAAARKLWLTGDAPFNLLLNQANARENPGKPSKPPTIDKAFSKAVTDLKIVQERTLASGSPQQKKVLAPAHTFHDTRHTFAYWTYLGLRKDEEEPWLYIQKRLGHKNLETTIGTYLSVFNEVATDTLAKVHRYFQQAREERNS